MIPFYVPVQPNLSTITEMLAGVHKRDWYTNFGELHNQFTEGLKAYLNCQFVLPVSSCTVGLMVALQLIQAKRVITTPFSFAATSSVLCWMNIEPIYVDIDSETKNIAVEAVRAALEESQDKVDAILATHVYGNPCDIEALEKLAQEFDVKVIYDAAHAFGVRLESRINLFDYGDISVLSFHATKVFHCIEGGAMIFHTEEEYELARRLINFGINRDGMIQNVGINGKLSEYHSAVGIDLLSSVDDILEKRRKIFNRYSNETSTRISKQKWYHNATPNGSYFPLFFESRRIRDEVTENLARGHVGYKNYFSLSLNNPIFLKDRKFITLNSEFACETVTCIPIHQRLTDADVDYIIQLVNEVVE